MKSLFESCDMILLTQVASGLVGVGRELAVDVLSEFESRIATLGDDLVRLL